MSLDSLHFVWDTFLCLSSKSHKSTNFVPEKLYADFFSTDPISYLIIPKLEFDNWIDWSDAKLSVKIRITFRVTSIKFCLL